MDSSFSQLPVRIGSPYQLYLPNKALLQAKVKEWIEEFEENEELKKLEENEK